MTRSWKLRTTLSSITQTCVKSVHRTSRRDPNVPQPLDILYVTYRDGNLGFCHTRFPRFIFPGFVHTHSTFTVPWPVGREFLLQGKIPVSSLGPTARALKKDYIVY